MLGRMTKEHHFRFLALFYFKCTVYFCSPYASDWGYQLTFVILILDM